MQVARLSQVWVYLFYVDGALRMPQHSLDSTSNLFSNFYSFVDMVAILFRGCGHVMGKVSSGI